MGPLDKNTCDAVQCMQVGLHDVLFEYEGFNPSLDSAEDQVVRIKQLEGDILTAALEHMMFNYILSVLF